MSAEASGFRIGGQLFELPGVTVMGPGDLPWIRLEARDYRLRPPGTWIRQVMNHTTWGKWPMPILPGAGPDGGEKMIADYWHTSEEGKSQSGGAHIIVDFDGSAVCLVDLALVQAYHATWSNPFSIGIEMLQTNAGGVYEATLATTVKINRFLCDRFGIPYQVPSRVYDGHPIPRMIKGGPDMAGCFGHRDNTEDRGRGDPGDDLTRRLIADGAEPLDFNAREDLHVWRARQRRLVILGEKLIDDGLAGPQTIAAMRRQGFAHGREIPV